MEGRPRAEPLVPSDSCLHMPDSAASVEPRPQLVTSSAPERHDDLYVRRFRRQGTRFDEDPLSPHVSCRSHSFPPLPNCRLPLEPSLALQLEARALPPFPLPSKLSRFRAFCGHYSLALCFCVSVHNVCRALSANKRTNGPRQTFLRRAISGRTSCRDKRWACGESNVSEKPFLRKSPLAMSAQLSRSGQGRE